MFRELFGLLVFCQVYNISKNTTHPTVSQLPAPVVLDQRNLLSDATVGRSSHLLIISYINQPPSWPRTRSN